MRVEEVKEKIVEYLKENGCANVSELMRFSKCGKSTIYNAIRELEEEGVIKTKKIKNRKMVYLVNKIPNYLKYLTALTAVILSLAFVSFSFKPANTLVVNFSSLDQSALNNYYLNNYNNCYIIEIQSLIFILTFSVLVGYWLAVLTLKYEDIVESIIYIKSKFNIQKLKRLF